MAIFTAVQGFLDDLEVDEVVPFEHQLIAFLHSSHPEIGASIRETKKLTDENEAALRAAIDEFKTRYKAAKNTETAAG